jgi:hypothetical protein
MENLPIAFFLTGIASAYKGRIATISSSDPQGEPLPIHS